MRKKKKLLHLDFFVELVYLRSEMLKHFVPLALQRWSEQAVLNGEQLGVKVYGFHLDGREKRLSSSWITTWNPETRSEAAPAQKTLNLLLSPDESCPPRWQPLLSVYTGNMGLIKGSSCVTRKSKKKMRCIFSVIERSTGSSYLKL